MITILHGALGSAHQFSALSSALGSTPQRIITFPGHGDAPDTGADWTIDALTSWLIDVLEKDGHPATIFGYSMGGYVALEGALRRPDLFTRIVTLGTKLAWSADGAAKEIRFLDPETILAKVPQFAADLEARHGVDRWREVLARTAGLMTDLGARPLLTHERMAACTVPVRYGLGDRDEMVTLDETLGFVRATPQAEFFMLPGTRHPIERVRPNLLIPMLEV
jgi:pimeloyl-ACP methyl ester carboxylesterase